MNSESAPHGAVNILYSKGDLVENTVGRLGSIPRNLLLATPLASFESPSPEMKNYLEEKYKDVPWQGNVEVYVGHSPLFRQLGRLFSSERRNNLFSRVVFGIPATVGGWVSGKLGRYDYYNPYAETVQVYHPDSAMAMNKIGRAEYYDQSKHPTLNAVFKELPVLNAYQEWKSSHNAMKHLTTPEERNQAVKIMEPMYGAAVGVDIGVGLNSLFPAMYPVAALAPAAGLLAGHIAARTGSQNAEGRNVFFDPRNEAAKQAITAAPALA